MTLSLSELMRAVRNTFITGYMDGQYCVENGVLSGNPMPEPGWIGIAARGHSGVYLLGAGGSLPGCRDGAWSGRLYELDPPPDFLRLLAEINAWLESQQTLATLGLERSTTPQVQTTEQTQEQTQAQRQTQTVSMRQTQENQDIQNQTTTEERSETSEQSESATTTTTATESTDNTTVSEQTTTGAPSGEEAAEPWISKEKESFGAYSREIERSANGGTVTSSANVSGKSVINSKTIRDEDITTSRQTDGTVSGRTAGTMQAITSGTSAATTATDGGTDTDVTGHVTVSTTTTSAPPAPPTPSLDWAAAFRERLKPYTKMYAEVIF